MSQKERSPKEKLYFLINFLYEQYKIEEELIKELKDRVEAYKYEHLITFKVPSLKVVCPTCGFETDNYKELCDLCGGISI